MGIRVQSKVEAKRKEEDERAEEAKRFGYHQSIFLVQNVFIRIPFIVISLIVDVLFPSQNQNPSMYVRINDAGSNNLSKIKV